MANADEARTNQLRLCGVFQPTVKPIRPLGVRLGFCRKVIPTFDPNKMNHDGLEGRMRYTNVWQTLGKRSMSPVIDGEVLYKIVLINIRLLHPLLRHTPSQGLAPLIL